MRDNRMSDSPQQFNTGRRYMSMIFGGKGINLKQLYKKCKLVSYDNWMTTTIFDMWSLSKGKDIHVYLILINKDRALCKQTYMPFTLATNGLGKVLSSIRRQALTVTMMKQWNWGITNKVQWDMNKRVFSVNIMQMSSYPWPIVLNLYFIHLFSAAMISTI